jgi:hypothetical protein
VIKIKKPVSDNTEAGLFVLATSIADEASGSPAGPAACLGKYRNCSPQEPASESSPARIGPWEVTGQINADKRSFLR